MSTTLDATEAKEERDRVSGPSVVGGTAEPSQPSPNRKPKQKTVAGKVGRSSLMLIRRVHLYSGIFMFPWVLLYGFTGWFFNHPRMFTGDQVVSFSAADFDSDALSKLPTADQAAQDVVEEMNFESFMAGGPEIELTDDQAARYTGFLTYSVQTDQAEHQVSVNPLTGDGEVRTTYIEQGAEAAEEEKPDPLAAVPAVDLESNALTDVQSEVPKILASLGLPAGEASSGRRSANLQFSAIADGVPCIVTYSLAGGRITSVRQDDRPQMETKSFLQRLHLARTYSPGFDTRWVWALLVDAMFVSMVFWGVSGLMMWWQVKRTRLIGGGVLVASVVFAALMAINMHDSLTASPGRGGHGHGRGGHGQRGDAEGGRGGRGFGGRGRRAEVQQSDVRSQASGVWLQESDFSLQASELRRLS